MPSKMFTFNKMRLTSKLPTTNAKMILRGIKAILVLHGTLAFGSQCPSQPLSDVTNITTYSTATAMCGDTAINVLVQIHKDCMNVASQRIERFSHTESLRFIILQFKAYLKTNHDKFVAGVQQLDDKDHNHIVNEQATIKRRFKRELTKSLSSVPKETRNALVKVYNKWLDDLVALPKPRHNVMNKATYPDKRSGGRNGSTTSTSTTTTSSTSSTHYEVTPMENPNKGPRRGNRDAKEDFASTIRSSPRTEHMAPIPMARDDIELVDLPQTPLAQNVPRFATPTTKQNGGERRDFFQDIDPSSTNASPISEHAPAPHYPDLGDEPLPALSEGSAESLSQECEIDFTPKTPKFKMPQTVSRSKSTFRRTNTRQCHGTAGFAQHPRENINRKKNSSKNTQTTTTTSSNSAQDPKRSGRVNPYKGRKKQRKTTSSTDSRPSQPRKMPEQVPVSVITDISDTIESNQGTKAQQDAAMLRLMTSVNERLVSDLVVDFESVLERYFRGVTVSMLKNAVKNPREKTSEKRERILKICKTYNFAKETDETLREKTSKQISAQLEALSEKVVLHKKRMDLTSLLSDFFKKVNLESFKKVIRTHRIQLYNEVQRVFKEARRKKCISLNMSGNRPGAKRKPFEYLQFWIEGKLMPAFNLYADAIFEINTYRSHVRRPVQGAGNATCTTRKCNGNTV